VAGSALRWTLSCLVVASSTACGLRELGILSASTDGGQVHSGLEAGRADVTAQHTDADAHAAVTDATPRGDALRIDAQGDAKHTDAKREDAANDSGHADAVSDAMLERKDAVADATTGDGGHPCAPSCAVGASCTTSSDCASHVCNPAGSCAPACSPLCDAGTSCSGGAECASGVCNASSCVTVASCSAILEANHAAEDGTYIIDPDGAGPNLPFSVHCDMTTDNGGWILMATLHTTNTGVESSVDAGTDWASKWTDDWFATDHGDTTVNGAVWVNVAAARFAPLIGTASILRATTSANAVKRYHFGLTATTWAYWNASRTVTSSNISVIGPFNAPGVMVSTSLTLTPSSAASSNGNWNPQGVFFLGTAPNGADSDDGTMSRFHVGTSHAPTYGYAGNQQVAAAWSLWLR